MSKVLYISDFSAHELPTGGAEANDKILLDNLDCDFIKSFFFTNAEGYDKVIVSNFFQMQEEGKRWLIDHGNYIQIQHDFLLSASRVPPPPDFIIPKEQLCNVEFFQRAEKVIFQTQFQKDIFDKNISLLQGINFGANLWSREQLDKFRAAPDKKNGRCLILQSSHVSKGEQAAIQIAEQLRLTYDILQPVPYDEFIDVLSRYSNVILWPQIPESFGRIAAEALMCGVVPISNSLMACLYEPFAKLERNNIIDYMNQKREELIRALQ